MAERAVVTAASRLHVGMLSIGRPGERQYGGIGAMLDRPGLRLRVCRAETLQATGPLAERALTFARQYCNAAHLANANFLVEVADAPREHVGLGVGTQLALAVAAGIAALTGSSEIDAVRLGRLVGRGERSAVGTHGFQTGGLLFDAGKLPGEGVSPLVSRIAIPAAWRFVLIVPRHECGVHGSDECRAFEALPPTAAEISQQLFQSAEALVKAVAAEDFATFSETLFRFNHTSGGLFARYQQGAYANERVAQLVHKLRGVGTLGVGQSSWGPTVFALAADAASAENLVQSCHGFAEARDCTLVVAAPQNAGAQLVLE